MDDNSGILNVKTWRLRKGVSLADIAASTKVSIRHLEAIESGQFKRLPGGIYNTNYIRQYARAIDFDESELIAFYEKACGLIKRVDNPPAEVPSSWLSKLLLQH